MTQIVNHINESKKKIQKGGDNKNGVTAAIIGSSGCGKSTLISEVFIKHVYKNPKSCNPRNNYDFNLISVYTESPNSDALQDLGDDVVIFSGGLDLDSINYQVMMNMTYGKVFNFVNFIDDCIHIKYIPIIEKLFLIMRNNNLTSLVSLQYSKLIPKNVRTSSYYIFLFFFNTQEGIEVATEEYLLIFIPGKNRQERMAYYYNWTKDHGFFLLDNLTKKAFKIDKKYKMEELNSTLSNNNLDHEKIYSEISNLPEKEEQPCEK